MNNLKETWLKVLKSALNTFKTFPAANACALGFTLVTMVRIQLDWPAQEAYNYLLNCLHLAFLVGTFLSIALIAGVRTYKNTQTNLKIGNLIGLLSAGLTFILLYFFGADTSKGAGTVFLHVSDIAAARVGVAVIVSLMGLIMIAASQKTRSDFSKAFFMVEKAFFVALIYGGVMMAGASSVAGAVEALLFNNMSEKVYMYIGAVVLFLAYTVFAGHFPDFQEHEPDEHWENAQKQPKFIEILFINILVPLMTALTVVLLSWAAKTVITGDWPSFLQLSSIAIGYSVSGIWLHVMITHHQTTLAKLYKRLYPVAALIVLVFEAWALIVQLSKYGLKTTEYFFILVWIVTVLSAVLLFFIKNHAHMIIAAMICVSAVFSVLPVVGYQILPIQMQIHRLEGILTQQGILQEGTLVPAKQELPLTIRYAITDAVIYLAYENDVTLPAWFNKELGDPRVFKKALGFDQIREAANSDVYFADNIMTTHLELPNEPIDIQGYDWMISLQQMRYIDNQATAHIKGDKGEYEIAWSTGKSNIPQLLIKKDGQLILTQSLQTYLDQLLDAYPPSMEGPKKASAKDMTLTIETPEISVLLVFSNINADLDINRDQLNYWVNISAVYFKEK